MTTLRDEHKNTNIRQQITTNTNNQAKFVEDKEVVNFHDYDNRYALHLAASEGHGEIVQWLVENGADINVKARDAHWQRPLSPSLLRPRSKSLTQVLEA